MKKYIITFLSLLDAERKAVSDHLIKNNQNQVYYIKKSNHVTYRANQ